ncbi:MAG: hypothetical protein IJ057_13250 [Bacteroidales bacterium]|nr:hypothetical protein [Bacteroidales bacterium]
MKRTYIKKVIGEVFKAMDQNGYKNCDIMELSVKTCIDRNAEMFVRVDAVINMEGEDGKSYKIRKDFDL